MRRDKPGARGWINRRKGRVARGEMPGRIVMRRPMAARGERLVVTRSGLAGFPSRALRERGMTARRGATTTAARAGVSACVSADRRRFAPAPCRAGAAARAMPAFAGGAQHMLRNMRGPIGRPRAAAASLTPPPRSPDATRAAHTRPAAPSGPHAFPPRSRCRAPSRGSGRHCARSTAGAR